MDKKIITLLFCMLFLSLASASPPRETFSGEGSYQITYNQRAVLKQNQSINLNFGVFNITSGEPIISGISCDFQLSNKTGGIIYKAGTSTLTDEINYGFSVDSQNFTQLGEMSYIIYCNKTGAGGIRTVPVLITKSGFILETSEAIIYVLFMGLLLFMFVVCFLGGLIIPWNHSRDAEGKIVSINDLRYAKIMLLSFTYIIALFLARFMMFLSENWLVLANFWVIFRWIYVILWAFMWPVIVLVVIIAIVNYLNSIKIKEQIFRNLT
jgi:hypothetical protein